MHNPIFCIVKNSLYELNDELEYDALRSVEMDTRIFGGEDGIDSLSLVRLIVCVERRIEETYAKRVNLADEKAMSQRYSPYRDVQSLVEFISDRLGDPSA